MIVKSVLMFGKVDVREGVAKATGNPYKMTSVRCLDDDYNVINLDVPPVVLEDETKMVRLNELEKGDDVEFTINVKPVFKGFGYTCTLVDL